MLRSLSVLVLSLLLIVGLAACGGGSDEGQDGQSAEENGGSNGTVDVAAAEKTFEQNCANCHGQNLEGRNGPKLENIGSKLSKEEILTMIKKGGGGMPGGLIRGEEAENVAAWLATME
ncbi:cytochrome c551 [Pseudalkalibacillus sp. SCS-8]|uniref:cytochrome c551 n=1 Tax=Pseudalkalibacillus nanhaiensis TaxID=3115291 RepID=UPI0032DA4F2F